MSRKPPGRAPRKRLRLRSRRTEHRKGAAAVIALWILGILAVLILLLCLTRVGVLARFGGELAVTVKLGLFRIQVLPASKKPPKHEKTTEKGYGATIRLKANRPGKRFRSRPRRDQGGPANPVAAAEKSAAPYPQGRSDRPAGCVGNSRGTGGTCGRRAAIRRAARSRLDRDAGAGTTAGDPPGRISTWMLILPRRRQSSWEAWEYPPGSARCCGSA